MYILCSTYFRNPTQTTEADYVFEVAAGSYSNGGHFDIDGYCCESNWWYDCINECDNHFAFCLRSDGTSHDDNANNCPLGKYNSGYLGGDNFNFRSPIASGIPNPMPFHVSGNWPVSSELLL